MTFDLALLLLQSFCLFFFPIAVLLLYAICIVEHQQFECLHFVFLLSPLVLWQGFILALMDVNVAPVVNRTKGASGCILTYSTH